MPRPKRSKVRNHHRRSGGYMAGRVMHADGHLPLKAQDAVRKECYGEALKLLCQHYLPKEALNYHHFKSNHLKQFTPYAIGFAWGCLEQLEGAAVAEQSRFASHYYSVLRLNPATDKAVWSGYNRVEKLSGTPIPNRTKPIAVTPILRNIRQASAYRTSIDPFDDGYTSW